MLYIYEKLKFPFIRFYKYFLFYLVNVFGENLGINTKLFFNTIKDKVDCFFVI